MRSIAVLTTSLGILLHTLLGWCPQHVGCTAGPTAACSGSARHQHQCKGHRHASSSHRAAPTSNHDQAPANPDAHHCDHADCLFLSPVESVQDLAPMVVGAFLPLPAVEPLAAAERAELRANELRHFLTPAQGQAARIARGLWLI